MTAADIVAARARLAGTVAATPCAYSETLSLMAGSRVFVKLENLQMTGSFNLIARIIERGLVKDGRLVRLTVTLRDRPGALAQLTGLVAQARANVLHIHHDRAFSRTRVGETDVELTLETSGRDQIATITRHLRQAGYAVEEVTPR